MKPSAIIAILLASLAFVACDKHDVDVENPDTDKRIDMSFSAKVSQGAETRATTSLNQNFLVFTWAEDDLLMNGYTVRKNASQQWTYDKDGDKDYGGKDQEMKFWNLTNEYYIFSAVSPLPKENGVTASVAADKKLSLTNVTANVSTNIDWLTARTKRTIATPKDEDELVPTHKFPSLNYPTDAVPLNFHHILSQIVFRIYAYQSMDIPLLEVKVGDVNTKGDYSNTGTGLGSWSDLSETKTLTAYSGELKSISTEEMQFASAYVIPQKLVTSDPGSPKVVQISVKTSDSGDPMVFDLDGEWEINKKYIYTFKVNAPTNIILINVKVDDWGKDEGSDTEETETNW